MATRIRLARFGTNKRPFYRVVAADKESPRDGRFLEVLGHYDPKNVKDAVLKKERIDWWISKGATPSDTVRQILKRMTA